MSSPAPPRSLPEGYTLHTHHPTVDAYLNLRYQSGLSPKNAAQATKALPGSWYMIHITYTPPSDPSTPLDSSTLPSDASTSPQLVAMSRIIGDGGWYFHISDMAVLPSHQRKGLGDFMMAHLLEKIVKEAPEGPYVNLIADPPGQKLYAKHGFVKTSETGRRGVGMKWLRP